MKSSCQTTNNLPTFSIFCFLFPIKISLSSLIAIVTSIHKGGNKFYILNYRSISLLNVFSKIFERAIKIVSQNTSKKIQSFLCHYLVSEKTLEQKMHWHNSREIYVQMWKKKIKLSSICIDISKAFDSISHNQLLNIFKLIGIDYKSFNLLKSYL